MQAPDQDVALSRPLTIAVVAMFLLLAFWVGLVFNAITIMLPKLVQQRVASGIPLTQVGVLATAVFLCGGMAQFAMGRAVERIMPHLVMSFIAGIQVIGILLALYTSGWWLLPSLALAVAAIYGQVTVNDFVLARYAPPAWRGRIYAIRFFLIFTMAGPAAWGIGRLYEQGGFNTVLGVGAAIAVLGALNTFAISALVTGAENRRGRGATAHGGGRCSRRSDACACVCARSSIRIFALRTAWEPTCAVLFCCFRSLHLPGRDAARPTRRRAASRRASSAPLRRRPRLQPRAGYAAALQARRHAGAGRRDARKAGRRREAAPRARKPASAAQPAAAAQGARATPRDIATCAQVKDHDAAIAGCTRIIEDGKQKPKGRAAAYYNRGNAQAAKGDQAAAIADYDEAIKLDPKNARALQQSRHRAQREGRCRRRDRRLQRGDQARQALCVGLFQPRQCLCGEGRDGPRDRGLLGGDQVQPAQRECLYRARRALSCDRRGREGARATWRSRRGSIAGTPMRCCGRISRSGAPSRRACSRGGKGRRTSR